MKKIRKSISSIFEEQDNQNHEDIKLGRFIIGILILLFISAAIGVFGCVLLFKDLSSYKDVLCTLLVATILFKPMVKLSIRKKD